MIKMVLLLRERGIGYVVVFFELVCSAFCGRV